MEDSLRELLLNIRHGSRENDVDELIYEILSDSIGGDNSTRNLATENMKFIGEGEKIV